MINDKLIGTWQNWFIIPVMAAFFFMFGAIVAPTFFNCKSED